MDLPSFLSWFSGFAENIEKQPNAKQWSRIVAKVAELEAAPKVPGAVVSSAAAAPALPSKPINESQWRAMYQAALLDGGFDNESAQEMARGVDVDMSRDPAAVAKSDAGPFLN